MEPTALLLALAPLALQEAAPPRAVRPTAAPTRSAPGTEALRPRWKPAKPRSPRVGAGEDPTRLVLKLADDLGARAVGGRLEAAPGGHRLAGVRAVLAGVPDLVVEPLIRLDPARLDAMRAAGQRATGEELADLTQFFVLRSDGRSARELLVQLDARDEVEIAYASPLAPTLPGDLAPSTPDWSWQQGYFGSHEFTWIQTSAWWLADSRGAGVSVADVEGSWNLQGMFGDAQTHEDLLGLDTQSPAPAVGSTATWLNPFGDTNHGTAVLGILGADRDAWGVDGLVPDATLRVSAAYTSSGWNVPNAILQAATAVGKGGVVLVELQIGGPNFTGSCAPNPQFGSVPMEHYPAEYAAIRLASAWGVHVVEPAGNGNQDLDDGNGGLPGTPCVSSGDASYPALYDLRVRSSGAIVVGGGSTSGGTNSSTNRGQRVDCFSQGEQVTTLGYGDLTAFDPDQLYTALFAGTSSASAILSGVVTVLEATHRETHGTTFPPEALRLFLRTTGNPSQTPALDRIGRFPRLQEQYYALATGPNPAVIRDGPGGTNRTGEGVAGVGDVDGDGREDIAVNDGLSASVTVVSGVTGTPLYTFTGYSGTQRALAGAGDVNADGFDDVIVGRGSSGGCAVFSGLDGSTLHAFTGSGVGNAVAGAGDVDGDGYDDFLVGEPLTGANGRAVVRSGLDGSAIHTIDGEAGFPSFGHDVAGAGDLDADGTPDFAVAASHQIPSGSTRKVYAFRGSDGALLWSVTGAATDGFGYEIAGAGDVDGDGRDDLIVGSPYDDTQGTDHGRATVYSGLDGSVVRVLDPVPPGTVLTQVGHSVAGIGDVNQDGQADLLIGAAGVEVGGPTYGAAWILSGATGGVLQAYLGEPPAFAQAGHYGWSVSTADVDGDGHPDAVVGAPGQLASRPEGRAYTYLVPLLPRPRGNLSGGLGTTDGVHSVP